MSCATHCCPVHGCKYNHSDCPVFGGKVFPTFPENNGCELCETGTPAVFQVTKAVVVQNQGTDKCTVKTSLPSPDFNARPEDRLWLDFAVPQGSGPSFIKKNFGLDAEVINVVRQQSNFSRKPD